MCDWTLSKVCLVKSLLEQSPLVEGERWNSALGVYTWFEAFTGLGLCCDPWFLGSTQFLEHAWSLDSQTHLIQRIVQETFICKILPGQNLPWVFPSRLCPMCNLLFTLCSQAMLFSSNNSSMCHLFLFPIWLFLNLPDKILFLVRAAHSGEVATWWRREVLQSKSVFYKQFLPCCRVIKWLQCLLGSRNDWIDPSPFYYPLESCDQLVCISQNFGKERSSLSLLLGLCPCAAVGAAVRYCSGPGPSHTKYTECLGAHERVIWGFLWLVSVLVCCQPPSGHVIHVFKHIRNFSY